MIELTNGQKEAISKAKEWFTSNSSKQIFEICGAAGTGKSTVVYSLIEELGLSEEEVRFVTYTGKASIILTTKGNNATTIHKLIYDIVTKEKMILDKNKEPMKNTKGEIYYENVVEFVKKDRLNPKIKLLVCDEVSMVDKKTLDDLKSFNIPMIVLGDPYQLKPINGDIVLLKDPDIILTEIMRQQEGNPLIHLATLAREKKIIPEGVYGSSFVINKDEILHGLDNKSEEVNKILTMTEMNICRTNKNRNFINNYIRHVVKGIPKEDYLPKMDEKIICRKNNWTKALSEEVDINLVNGLTGTVVSPILTQDINKRQDLFYLDFRPDFCNEDYFTHLPVSSLNFIDIPDTEKKIREIKQYKYSKIKNIIINDFEFAYILTCHLCQGSEYKDVFILDEYYGDDYYNSLYTAITRAQKRIILAKQYPKQYF